MEGDKIMKSRIVSVILVLTMFSVQIPIFAENETFEEENQWNEAAPTPIPQNEVYYETNESEPETKVIQNVHTEILPADIQIPNENSISLNDLQNGLPDAGSATFFSAVTKSNEKKLRDVFAMKFGDDYLKPYEKREDGQRIEGNTNRLVVEETDLRLPGKNGLDLVLKRKHDNQDYNDMCIFSNSSVEVPTNIPTYICTLKNTETNKTINVAFFTEDDFYENMADGCYLGSLDELTKQTYKDGDKTYSFYNYIDIKKKIQNNNTGTFYEYDSSVEPIVLTRVYETKGTITKKHFSLSHTMLGSNWTLLIPEISIILTNATSDTYSSHRTWWNDYTGVFRDINGNVYSLDGDDTFVKKNDGTTTYSSNFYSDDNKYLSFEKMYNIKTLHTSGAEYNFVVRDSNGLTYYLYNPYAKEPQPGARNFTSYITAIEDNHGNIIQYKYDAGYKNLIKIIDTYGREINITKSNNNTTVSYYDDIAQETKSIIYENTELPSSVLDEDGPIKQKNIKRFTVTNQLGEKTIYDTRDTDIVIQQCLSNGHNVNEYPNMSTSQAFEETGSNNIERIIYPTGAETRYKYKCLYAYIPSGKAMQSKYAVANSYDIIDGKKVNEKSYSFMGSGAITITQTKEASNQKTVTKYNANGLPESIKTTPISKTTPQYTTSYVYDDHDKPEKITVITPISTGTTHYSYVNGYPDRLSSEYNDRQQIYYTYHTDADGKDTDKIKNTEYRYKYNSSYRKDYNVVTELTADKKNIEYERVIQNNIVKSQTKYEYDSEGNITAIKQWTADTNGDGTLDENDKFNTVTNAYTNTAEKTKDIVSTAPNIKNADGASEGSISVERKLNIYGSPTLQKDANGSVTTVEYDDLNRPVKYNFPNSAEKLVSYTIDPANKNSYTTVTDEAGIQYKSVYDGIGRLTGKYRLNGSNWNELEKYKYDADGRLIEKKYGQEGASFITEKYTYDEIDNLKTKEVYEGWRTLLYTEQYSYYWSSYKETGEVTVTTTAADGTVTAKKVTKYDKYGNVTETEATSGDTTITTACEYDYLDRKTKETDANGNSTAYEYDCLGQLVKQTNPDNSTLLMQYDMAGQAISATDAMGNTTVTDYDAMGRVIQVTSPFNNGQNAITKTYYDKNSNVIKESVRESENSYRSTEYKYDVMGNMLSVSAGEGEEKTVTQYKYDTANRLTKMTTGLSEYSENPAGGASTVYKYNNQGFLESVTDPMGKEENYIDYDSYGNVTLKCDRNGNAFQYTYGAYGVTSENMFGFAYNNIEYNSAGQITKTETKNQNGDLVEESYTYDPFGRMTSKTSADGTVQNYTYDGNANVLNYNMAKDGETKNSITYTYNTMNRLTQLENGDTIGYIYQYDNNGNLTKTMNTKTANFDLDVSYNAANLPTEYETGIRGKKYTYNMYYFVNGQKYLETSSTDLSSFKSYEYNSLGQLEFEHIMKDNKSILELDYTYDRSGNRTKMRSFNDDAKKWDRVVDYTYDANNRMTEASTNVNGSLTDKIKYYYDDNGNMTAEQKKTYTTAGNAGSRMSLSGRIGGGSAKIYQYDAFNRLIQYNDDSTEAAYTYGAGNLRASKTVNGTKTDFVWNGQNLAGETKNGAANVYTYDPTGIIATKTPDEATRYIKDPHGNIIAGVKNNAIADKYDYTAFGIQVEGENISNSFGYCGEYLDNETGLVYLRNRYYNTTAGRFITEDPIRDGANWYVYGNNNPVMNVDPLGLDDYVFYGTEKQKEAAILLQKSLNKGDEVHLIEATTPEKFYEAWANMGTEEDTSIDTVYIMVHGKPESILSSGNQEMYADKLEKKTIGTIILTACDTGNMDFDNNFAKQLLNTQDVQEVIAPDGLGSLSGSLKLNTRLEISSNYAPKSSGVQRKGNGYVMYQKNNNDDIIITKGLTKDIYYITPMELLKKGLLYSYLNRKGLIK